MPARPPLFRRIQLIGKPDSTRAAAILRDLAIVLQELGAELLDETTPSRTPPDLAIVAGGDGTMLNTARRLCAQDVPLIGINQGRLGFITDIAADQCPAAILEMVQGNYTEERRFLLDGQCDGQSGSALNEIVVRSAEPMGVAALEVSIDGQFAAQYVADGLILATPTGSTAYALSVNGPILHPGAAALVLAPIAPHTLSQRPLVLGADSEVSVTLKRPQNGQIYFDGQGALAMGCGQTLRARRSRLSARFLHPPGWNFFAQLRGKLRWHALTVPD